MVNPILRDIPEAFETDRLLIRAPRAGDGPALNAAILETWDDLHAWMPWAKEFPSIEESEENSRQAYCRFLSRESLRLCLVHRESGLMLGSSGFPRLDWTVPRFEAGYWCRKRFQGQGYITEALAGVLQFGFQILGAKRIEVRCDSTNLPSVRVAQRLEMTREAELRQYSVGVDGTLRNDLVFALTDSQWQANPRSATPCRVVT
jgi:RimJ/RimL family protein N-acetyltransferase